MEGSTLAVREPAHAHLIEPYGGTLVDLLVPAPQAAALIRETAAARKLVLSGRSICDLELLATGALSPLDGFMGEADYVGVIQDMRLASGLPWTMPITLPVADADKPSVGETVVLTDERNRPLGILEVREVYRRDPREAELVFRTTDTAHPLVAEMQGWGPWYVAGRLQVVHLPEHYDFRQLRRTPAETRAALAAMGNDNVVAFQTRNPMHRVHEELTKRAAARVGGSLMIHPAVGMTKPGDVDHFTRVRCYKAMVEHYYDPNRTLLSLLPIAMRMGGPREAVWHATIRRNYGANHFVVGRNHASPGVDSKGVQIYGPTDAQDLLRSFEAELGVTMVPFEELVYLKEEERYVTRNEVPAGGEVLSISGTQLRNDYLARGRRLPDWFSRPQVAEILASVYKPRQEQGLCIWLTGLPCSGKSTIAEVLEMMLMEHGRSATMLDGDVVRQHLSKGLGFSREDRIANNLRIAFVAAEIVRHGGTVICPAVSPYEEARAKAREMVGPGNFLLVHVDTPLSECEKRDVKGMYALAHAGKITGFTGVDDPYEVPPAADVTVKTVEATADACAEAVLDAVRKGGFVG